MIFFNAFALLAIIIIFLILRDRRRCDQLPSLDATATPSHPATLSIIIPARNEAHNIGACLEGALSQSLAGVDVIVVDDGSTDDTPRIIAALCERHRQRLRAVQGRPLPQGWVGKCNACLHGASFAAGDWLLFLDADTLPQPALASALLTFAQLHNTPVVTAFPLNLLPTLPEKTVLPAFFQFILTAFPLQALVTMEPPAKNALANGQCLLIQRDVYWSLGGHEAVKDKVLEDVEFAQALRRAGHRVGLATAFNELQVRMYRSFDEIVQGLGKHASAGVQAGRWRAFYAVGRMAITLLCPPLMLVVCAFAGMPRIDVAWVAPALIAVLVANAAWVLFWARRYRQWYRLPARYAVLAPIGLAVYFLIVARGILLVRLKRGVAWKGRVYS